MAEAWYGSKFGRVRPPGLPASARSCSTTAESLALLRPYAFQYFKSGPHLDQPSRLAILRFFARLCKDESSFQLGRPANSYDSRPEAQRPVGKSKVTAWGIWQCNDPATRRLREGHDIAGVDFPDVERFLGVGSCREPVATWDVRTEFLSGLLHYGDIVDVLVRRGSSLRDALIAARLMHSGPAYVSAFLRGSAYNREGSTPGGRGSWQYTLQRAEARADAAMARAS